MMEYNQDTIQLPPVEFNFRPKRLNVVSTEFMKEFKKEYPQYKKYSNKELIGIIDAFHTLLHEEIIEHPEGFEFPQSTGYCFIGTCNAPSSKKNYDLPLSKKYNKWIRHRNFETDNKLAKIFYTNFPSKYKFAFSQLWKFKACRRFSRLVSKTYPEKWPMYIKVDNYEKISDRFKKDVTTQYFNARKSTAYNDYNEFKLD